jgi:nitroreductase/dihydropteridine reductase
MSILDTIRTRYTTKHYDATKAISAEDLRALREVLRLCPSSVNLQPWHFFEASTREARERLLPAIMDFNRDRVLDASVVFVFAAHKAVTEEYLDKVIGQEVADGRFSREDAAANVDAGRRQFAHMHEDQLKDSRVWMAHQTYIAMGFLLLAAAQMGIDATPIEGLYQDKMDEILGLKDTNLATVLCVSLGYRSANDGNATRPKSRMPLSEVLTVL